MERFLTSNETFFRLARTILQGVLGVVAANIGDIVGDWHFSTNTKAIIVALVMSELGKHIETEDVEMDDTDEYEVEENE